MTTALRKKIHQNLLLAGLSEEAQKTDPRAVRQLVDPYPTPAAPPEGDVV